MLKRSIGETKEFDTLKSETALKNKQILHKVYHANKEKGYDPIGQVVGYLITGDPAYITNHNDARTLMRRIDRHKLIEDIVKNYLGIKNECKYCMSVDQEQHADSKHCEYYGGRLKIVKNSNPKTGS